MSVPEPMLNARHPWVEGERKYWLRRVAHWRLERDTAERKLRQALERADEHGASEEEIRAAQDGKPAD